MTDSRDSGLVVYALDREGTFFSRLLGLCSGLIEKLKALLVLTLWFCLWSLFSAVTIYGLFYVLKGDITKTDGTVANTRWLFCLLSAATVPLWLAFTIRLLKGLLPLLHRALLPSGNYGGGQFKRDLQTAVQTNAEQGEVPLAHFFIDDLFAEIDFGMSNFVFAMAVLMALSGYGFALYLQPIEPVALTLFIGGLLLSIALLFWLTELTGNIDGLTAAICHGLLIFYAALLWQRFPMFVKPLLLALLPILVFETFLLLRRVAQMCKRRLLVLTTGGMRFIPLKLSLFPYPHLKAASSGELMPIASITARPGPWGERWRMNFTFGAFEEICPVFVRARMIAQIAGAAGMEIKVQEMRAKEGVHRSYRSYALCLLWSLWFVAIAGPTSHFFLTFSQDFEPRIDELFKSPQEFEMTLQSATSHHPFSLSLHSALAHCYLNKGNKKGALQALSPVKSLLSMLPRVLYRFPKHRAWQNYAKVANYLALNGRDDSVAPQGWEPSGKATSHFRKALALLLSSKLTKEKYRKGCSLLMKAHKMSPDSPGPRFVNAIIIQRQLFEGTDGSSLSQVLGSTEKSYERARLLLKPLTSQDKWRNAATKIANRPAIPQFRLLYFPLLREYLDEGKISSLKRVKELRKEKDKDFEVDLSSLRDLAVNPPNDGRELLSALEETSSDWPENMDSLSGSNIKMWFKESYGKLGRPNIPVDINQRANLDPASSWLKECFSQ